MKRILLAAIGMAAALLLAVLGGWMWGTAGSREATSALADSGYRLHAALARGHLLEARVHLFEVNFGNAVRSLEAARADLETLAPNIERERGQDVARAIRKAIELAAEAQRLAGLLDQAAHSRTADAIRLLNGL
ncbi:MAG: hypothetical protein AB1806_05950 [Acidobacteriota bacterium]